MLPDVWTVVLAGGAGKRLSILTQGIPKQFWAFRGGPTLIESTARRTAAVSPPARRVTVVDASHAPHVSRLRSHAALGHVTYQPGDRGTAAGVLLGITMVLRADPDAVVLVTPADHGVARADHFRRGIAAAARAVRAGSHEIVLFGVEPTAAADDYGWITPETLGAPPVEACVGVRHFSEKPGRREAQRLLETGSVWNTMVLVGRARAVLAECQRQIPTVTETFLAAMRQPQSRLTAFLAARYRTLPAADFSRDVIARARGLALYTWPAAMGWSDLGTPERLLAWHRETSLCGVA